MVKIAYLTIDDSPSENMKEKVEFLMSKKIPAIWFCRGDFLEKRPEPVIFAIKNGFVIGNHSYSHPHFSEIPLKQCLEEIEKTDKIIEEIYKKTRVKRPGKVFRFPYGDKGGGDDTEKGWPENRKDFIQTLQDFLKKLGYTQPKFKGINYQWYKKAGLLKDRDVYWTYDCLEWAVFRKNHLFGIDSLEKVFERMEEDVPEGCRGLNFPGSEEIILIHDHPESTPLFKPIIERLLSKGIEFRLPKLG